MKTQVLEIIGETGLQRAAAVNAALLANVLRLARDSDGAAGARVGGVAALAPGEGGLSRHDRYLC